MNEWLEAHGNPTPAAQPPITGKRMIVSQGGGGGPASKGCHKAPSRQIRPCSGILAANSRKCFLERTGAELRPARTVIPSRICLKEGWPGLRVILPIPRVWSLGG